MSIANDNMPKMLHAYTRKIDKHGNEFLELQSFPREPSEDDWEYREVPVRDESGKVIGYEMLPFRVMVLEEMDRLNHKHNMKRENAGYWRKEYDEAAKRNCDKDLPFFGDIADDPDDMTDGDGGITDDDFRVAVMELDRQSAKFRREQAPTNRLRMRRGLMRHALIRTPRNRAPRRAARATGTMSASKGNGGTDTGDPDQPDPLGPHHSLIPFCNTQSNSIIPYPWLAPGCCCMERRRAA